MLLIMHNDIYINYIIPSSKEGERDSCRWFRWMAYRSGGLPNFYTMAAHCWKMRVPSATREDGRIFNRG